MATLLDLAFEMSFTVREVGTGRMFSGIQMPVKFEITLPDHRMDGVVTGAGGQVRGVAGDYILFDSQENTYFAVRNKDERGGHVFEKQFVRI